MKYFKAIIPTRKFCKIYSGIMSSEICTLERFVNLIELFGFGMTEVSFSFNNTESLRESGIKNIGTDFDSCCEGKNNFSSPVSTSSVLT